MNRAAGAARLPEIPGRVARVRERIAVAAARAGRRPEDVTLVAVTKGVDPDSIRAAVAAGIQDIGESRVQEAAPKIRLLGPIARWHLVGHLQRNKAGLGAGLFSVIHSVDSLRLAEALDRRAQRSLEILLQVNVAGERQKFGAAQDDLSAIARGLAGMRALRLIGLMTIPPLSPAPEHARPIFRRLRQLRDELARVLGTALPHLSMGMSDDFEVAVEEGATMVRIGRAIFNPPPEIR